MKLFVPTILASLLSAGAIATEVVSRDFNAQAPSSETVKLPEGELRLRRGIVLLGTLCQCMADVKSYDTAEAAVPQVMRLCEELQQWTQSFSNLPPLSELEAQVYEERYLPTIRKINHILEAQADRLGAAEYYGSRNLPAALVRIAQIGHN